MHIAHTYSIHIIQPQVSRKDNHVVTPGAGPGLRVHHAGHHPGAQEGRDDAPHLENKQSHGEIIINN